MKEIDVKYLADCLDYNHISGDLVWKKRPRNHFKTDRVTKIWNTRFSGRVAGTVSRGEDLYTRIRIRLCGSMYLAHRIAWALHYGEWPKPNLQIDHINGDATDNRIINLRVVSNQENSKNSRMNKNNASGFSGVSWSKQSGKWKVRIHISGKETHIGSFQKIEDAVVARKMAEKKYGYHANHGRA